MKGMPPDPQCISRWVSQHDPNDFNICKDKYRYTQNALHPPG
jgi:hypothetical protein